MTISDNEKTSEPESINDCFKQIAKGFMEISLLFGDMNEEYILYYLKKAFGLTEKRSMANFTKDQVDVKNRIKKVKLFLHQLNRVIILLNQENVPHNKLQNVLNKSHDNFKIFEENMLYIWVRRNRGKTESASKEIYGNMKSLQELANLKLKQLSGFIKPYNKKHKPLKLAFGRHWIKLPN